MSLSSSEIALTFSIKASLALITICSCFFIASFIGFLASKYAFLNLLRSLSKTGANFCQSSKDCLKNCIKYLGFGQLDELS